MSEDTNNDLPGDATPADAPAVDAPQADAPAAEDYSFVPAKFLKEDGSPDFKKLANSYTGLEKKLGQKPGIGASSIEEYEFDFGEGFEVDTDRAVAFKEAALAKGFSKDQYALVMDTYKQMLDANTWTADKTESVLKEAWGNDFQAHAQAAQRAFQEFAPSDASPHDPVWNHPVVMKLLARIGGELGEDSMAGKSNGVKAPVMTEAEVADIMKSPDYRNGNRELHAKVTAWYQANRK